MLTHQRFSEKEHDVELDVIDAAGVKKTDELLDVGCGTGSFSGAWAWSVQRGVLRRMVAGPLRHQRDDPDAVYGDRPFSF